MIAALYVEEDGVYYGLPDVDPWAKSRDARLYGGPHPVVAHPPCERWCALAPLNERRYGHKVGDDGGCFAAALAAVRAWGGVLEHPAFTRAWSAFSLPRPRVGAWTRDLGGDGWVTCVSQACYGHAARKLTWLYFVGRDPPVMDWRMPDSPGRIGPLHGTRDRVIITARVSWLSNHGTTPLRRVHKAEAYRTPVAFRDLLLSIARAAAPAKVAA